MTVLVEMSDVTLRGRPQGIAAPQARSSIVALPWLVVAPPRDYNIANSPGIALAARVVRVIHNSDIVRLARSFRCSKEAIGRGPSSRGCRTLHISCSCII
jgi:hypothetical protein